MLQFYFCFLDVECGSVETIITDANNFEHAKDKARIELGLGPEEEPIGACAVSESGNMYLTL